MSRQSSDHPWRPSIHFPQKHSQRGQDCHRAAPSVSQGQSLPQRQCRSLSARPANSRVSPVKPLCEVLWAYHQHQRVPECVGFCSLQRNRSCQGNWNKVTILRFLRHNINELRTFWASVRFQSIQSRLINNGKKCIRNCTCQILWSSRTSRRSVASPSCLKTKMSIWRP